MSSFWRVALRLQYRILGWLDPLVRALWRRLGIGITVELRVKRRLADGTRSRLVGLLHAADARYIGHPNGHVGWTRDLQAAGTGLLVWPNGAEWRFLATLLPVSREREAAIRATWQQPFPGNVVYRLARRHILAVGVYFRLDPVE